MSLPKEGRVIRPTYRRAGREVGFWAPAYSRQLLYKALVERISVPAGASRVRPADAEPVTTAQIAASLRRWGRFNHSVALCGPLQYPERDLPVAPYTFGCWLGDGGTMTAGFTCADKEILEHIRDDGYVVTHHASTRMQYTISNRPERERRIAEALALAAQGMSVERAALMQESASRPCFAQPMAASRRDEEAPSSRPHRPRSATGRSAESSGSLGPSTFRSSICVHPSRSAVPCSPGCSTRTATAALVERSSSRPPTGTLPTESWSWCLASDIKRRLGPSAVTAALRARQLPTRLASRRMSRCSG